MDTFNIALQPVWDLINIFRGVFILGFIGMGVGSAFFLKNLIVSLGIAGFIFLVASYLSNLMPGLALQVSPYFWSLGIGFVVGSIVKWFAQTNTMSR